MTNSIIALKGNFLSEQKEIFETFKYKDLEKDDQFSDLSTFYAYLFDNYVSFSNNEIVLRGIWFNNGWTIICDPETVDIFNVDALVKLSNKFSTEVLTFVIQTTSGSFGFAKYNLTTQRSFFASEGKISENIGSPIAEEQGLNINDHVFAEDITGLANKLGIDLENLNEQTFIAKQLGYNDELAKELQQFKASQPAAVDKGSKPWWKFW